MVKTLATVYSKWPYIGQIGLSMVMNRSKGPEVSPTLIKGGSKWLGIDNLPLNRHRIHSKDQDGAKLTQKYENYSNLIKIPYYRSLENLLERPIWGYYDVLTLFQYSMARL